MAEDNLTRQADEIEVLSSIYGDEWRVVDEAQRSYSMEVKVDQKPDLPITLQIHMYGDYPSNSPPCYELTAPWLRGQERINLSNSLEQLYCENTGEIIIFLWIECIREFLNNRTEIETDVKAATGSNVEDEGQIDEGLYDDGFDPGDLEPEICHSLADLSPTLPGQEVPMPEIHHGESLSDRRSVFQAHLAAVQHKQQVKMVLDSLLENRKIAAATHNIVAYRITPQNAKTCIAGCEDDGEHGAGNRMLHLIRIIGADNVMVVVTRWYGGVHLGPDRFKHINSLTRQILEEHGFIPDKHLKKGDKKGPKANGPKTKGGKKHK